MARRRFSIFSLSFLDVMFCGFGAVVLIFVLVSKQTDDEFKVINKEMLSEIRLLDYQVQTGEKDLFQLQVLLEELKQRIADSAQKLLTTEVDIDLSREEFKDLDLNSFAQLAHLNRLKSDVETREEELKRLRALQEASKGTRIREFEGAGDRQYLTGLKVGGKHILIAMDTSASMLDDTIVNVLRRRNMSEERKRLAPKWQRAIRTVEWLSTQIPLDANFQIYGFNVEATSFLPEEHGKWIPLGEGRELERSLNEVRNRIPDKGTSLENLITAMSELTPLPDNVYLIIDSLPTQGTREPRAATVSAKERLKLFGEALRRLPANVPVNVIMFPMEGDLMAAAAYWNLARTTGGSFLSPSRDWP
ncbi:MAG: VWA domain-containing protein [Gammaproteobacteria bacterium]|nr:MAG: VWA domain-containing protein [Gammaproteobacteria bacterium]